MSDSDDQKAAKILEAFSPLLKLKQTIGSKMILKKEQIDEMQEAAKPLVKWLNENCRPHCKVIVEPDGAEVVEGSASVKITEFIKD